MRTKRIPRDLISFPPPGVYLIRSGLYGGATKESRHLPREMTAFLISSVTQRYVIVRERRRVTAITYLDREIGCRRALLIASSTRAFLT